MASGGALGAVLRFGIQQWSLQQWGDRFPLGTLIINLTGAFLIGFIMTFFATRENISNSWKSFLVTGILGGYTTFSAFTWETLQLAQTGQPGAALVYTVASFTGGMFGVVLGSWVGRFA